MRGSSIVIAGLISAALVVSGCAKNSSSSTTTTSSEASPAESPASSGAMSAAAGGAAKGAQVFSTNCASCHQAQGRGVPGTFPPLVKNPVVTGDPTAVIKIVKDGLSGKITVNGKTYNGMMPAWKGNLSDADIAAVITYIRTSWGNKASPVTPAQVSAVQ
ncbi:MAG: c-type cytochrome [Vulcanimicrobiaceae bacterium]